MELDHETFSDQEDTIVALRNRLARAQGVQPIEHEEAKRLLREAAAKAAASVPLQGR